MSAPALPAQANRTLLAAILATVAMLFTAFAAAYLERAAGRGWEKIALPGILWANTFALLLSSAAVELARRKGSRRALLLGLLLGVLFLAGQLAAWGQLRAAGVFLPTNPYASFFYLLSGVHAVHVAAGILALALAAGRPRLLALAAGFWHFMGGIWLYVLLVLKVLG
jgi:cytochrome c oxidase subunit 3